MKIQDWIIHPYKIPMLNGKMRSGIVLEIRGPGGQRAMGEIAPLPNWSSETLEEALDQLFKHKKYLLNVDWSKESLTESLESLQFYPSVFFGIESALLNLVDPLPPFRLPISAFFSGTPSEVLLQAKARQREGFKSAKLKVGHLNFNEALALIRELKDNFHLRIDVNRAWETKQALAFFSQLEGIQYDYVEEPFKNPQDLPLFKYTLGVDESFPKDISLKQMEQLPHLKALVYKPTLQGGLSGCRPLHHWTTQRGIQLVLSSCYESEVGLQSIANIAYRLSLKSPLGTGTSHFFCKSIM